jgi:hypothetical protein
LVAEGCMAFLRFNRDKRGYEHFYLVEPVTNRRGKSRPRVLYWYRTPPNIRVGRAPFDEDVQRALEAQNPTVSFDWRRIIDAPIPSADVEKWRDRRRVERAEKAARRITTAAERPADDTADRRSPDDIADQGSPIDDLEALPTVSDGVRHPATVSDGVRHLPSTVAGTSIAQTATAGGSADPFRKRRRRRRGRGQRTDAAPVAAASASAGAVVPEPVEPAALAEQVEPAAPAEQNEPSNPADTLGD